MIISDENVKQYFQHVKEPIDEWAIFLGEYSQKLGEDTGATNVRLTQFIKLNDNETLIVWEVS
ncbi:hypothetical protein L3137_08895 [Bacillus sonorensis]|uniref:hypothetical protein n=1 Tax=Bacillus sonorensis TaxID=119858 RepID=UPI001F1AABF2|nr:hypothetical protein [Bacillus sonorensis]MCF7617393.1 hypothetical protein [Bacillus sonorensis]